MSCTSVCMRCRLEVAIGQVGLDLGSSRAGRVSLHVVGRTGSGRVRVSRVGLGSDWVRSICMLCFFQIFDRFRLDWRSFDLGSGRVWSGSDRVESVWFFLKNQIKLDSSPDGSDVFLGSGQILPPLDCRHDTINKMLSMEAT
jgi:hypothetical protein